MSILGNRVLRKEDPRFLRGEATYVENLPLEGARTVTFVRSPFAHARITGIDASAAEALPNIQVLTGADFDGVVDRARRRSPCSSSGCAVRSSPRTSSASSVTSWRSSSAMTEHPAWTPPSSSPSSTTRCRSCSIRRRRRRTSCCSSLTSGRTSRAAPAAWTTTRRCSRTATSSSRTRSSASAWPPCPLEVRSAAAEPIERQDHRLALDAGAAPGPPRPLPDARARAARAADHRAGRRRRLRREERASAPRRRSSSGWRRTTAPGSLDGDAHREHERARPRPRPVARV